MVVTIVNTNSLLVFLLDLVFFQPDLRPLKLAGAAVVVIAISLVTLCPSPPPQPQLKDVEETQEPQLDKIEPAIATSPEQVTIAIDESDSKIKDERDEQPLKPPLGGLAAAPPTSKEGPTPKGSLTLNSISKYVASFLHPCYGAPP